MFQISIGHEPPQKIKYKKVTDSLTKLVTEYNPEQKLDFLRKVAFNLKNFQPSD